MSEKLLSIVVPSYNSQDYLSRCLDSLMPGGGEVEVIVVDDGSTDRTADIAREYISRYPGIVRLHQQENGGHGAAINSGIALAAGAYFKVVDSDDRLDGEAYQQVLSKLRSIEPIDLLITNYVYEYYNDGKSYTMRYRNMFPQDKVITWDKMQRARFDQIMLMHSFIYRTELLRQCGLKLPEHTFYEDNLFAYVPLPYVKKLLYFNCNLYRYYIGRADQSVNTQVMIKRVDQQLRVTRLMIGCYDLYRDVSSKNLSRYMIHHLSMMVATSIIHINLSEEEDKNGEVDALWEFIRAKDERLYTELRRSFVNLGIILSQKVNQKMMLMGYNIAKRIYKFC
ncbi:MAG: glycosyltransferase family 2 protein [Oscillospiraceae bacterium]|nr:glycosyltransferase family 2 protein [Oscillospiraceae bacterium]